jgi:hypothetical protein
MFQGGSGLQRMVAVPGKCESMWWVVALTDVALFQFGSFVILVSCCSEQGLHTA